MHYIAFYLPQGTQANVERVVKDMEAGLYEYSYINFAHDAPRAILEDLALGALKSGKADCIRQVFDQYVSFMALDSGLFSLGLPRSYVELNDPSAQDLHIEVGNISMRLISA